MTIGLAMPGRASATPGDLDGGFSKDGFVQVDLGGTSTGVAMAFDAASRIVVAATAKQKGISRPYVIRVRSDGSLDPAFGRRGIARLPTTGEASTLAIDAQGRIVVAGVAGPADLSVVRLQENGAADRSFGSGGIATLPVAGLKSVAGITLDQSGGVLAVGTVGARPPANTARDQVVAVRFDATRAVDTAYVESGVLHAGFAGLEPATATATATLPGGGTFVSGFAGFDAQAAIARLTPDGLLDPSFSDDGVAVLGPEPSTDVVVDSAGRALVGGAFRNVLRVLDDGTIDPSFPSRHGHRYTLDSEDVAVGPDGRIISSANLGGCSRGCTNLSYALTALTPDGLIDRGFAGRGVIFQDFARYDDVAEDLAIQPDHGLVVIGQLARKVLIVRHELSPGKPDRDADRRVDRKDRCPLRYAHTDDGCPRFGRSLTFRWQRKDDLFTGRIRSGDERCVNRRRLEVRMKLPGFDKIIAKPVAQLDGKWLTDAPLNPGAYYAQIDKDFSRPIGFCAAARSDEITIR